MNSAEGFALIITLWRHKKSLKLVYAKTLSAKTLKLVLAINSNLKVCARVSCCLVCVCQSELLLDHTLVCVSPFLHTEVHMMYTVIVLCMHWVDVTGGLVRN